jgi:gliding motility-associated-like protein
MNTDNRFVKSGLYFPAFFLRKLRPLLFLFFVLGGWNATQLQATHIVGGDMTYRCLGNNEYEITLTVYRDCFYGDIHAYFDSIASVGVFNSNNQLVQELLIPLNPMLNDTLDLPFADSCLFIASDICVHTTYYRDTVTLNPTAGGYTLAYQRCCRNATIYNIFNPVETGATFSTYISEFALQNCNSSAVFNDYPTHYICVNEPIFYDHSASDTDGDSLVYSLCTPFSGGTLMDGMPQPPSAPPFDTVVWVTPPYSKDNMLGFGAAPLAIDPQTGLLTGTPGLVGQFVVGVCVEEYRNGQLISTTRRDFQYNVGLCATIIADIDAPDAQCDELTVAFENESLFANQYQWDFNDPGNPADMSTQKDPVYTFSDTGHYTVRLIAQPGSVCADTAFHDIFLQYNSTTADFEVEVLECADSVIINALDMSVDPVSPVVDWSWELSYGSTQLTSTDQNPQFIIPRTPLTISLALYAVSENGCEDSHFYVFNVDPNLPTELLEDSLTICLGESVELNPLFVPGYVYQWTPSGLLSNSSSPNPLATPTEPTLFTVVVEDTAKMCQIERTVFVDVKEVLLDFDFHYACDGYTVEFENTSQDISDFFWDFGVPGVSIDTSVVQSPVFTFPDTGTYTVMLRSFAGFPCLEADTLIREVIISGPLVRADVATSYTDCEPGNLQLLLEDQTVFTQGTGQSWEWYLGDSLLFSGQQPPLYTFTESDTLQLSLIVESDEACVDTLQRDLPLWLIDDSSLLDTVAACPGESVALYPGANPAYQYVWTPDEGLDNPFAPNPQANPDGPLTYQVMVTAIGADTCELIREITVIKPEPQNLTTGPDFATCEQNLSVSAATDTGNSSFVWTNPAGDILGQEAGLSISPQGVTTYLVEASDIFGCNEKDTLVVTGNAVDVDFDEQMVFCKGDNEQLEVINIDPSDQLDFSWEPADQILLLGNTGQPFVSTETPGSQVFTFVAENQFNCQDTGLIELVVLEDNLGDHTIEGIQCDGLTVLFSHSGPNADFYEWYFEGLGSSLQPQLGAEVSYTFPDTGLYEVALILPAEECPDTIYYPIQVEEGPFIEAVFGNAFTDCTPLAATLSFSDSSYHLQTQIIDWQWTFSNGQTSDQPNPTLTITEDQELTVKLMVTSQAGCVDSIEKILPLNIIENNELPDEGAICPGESLFLNPDADTTNTFSWMPALGLDNPDSPNPLAQPMQSTLYTVTISAESALLACTLVDSIHVTVFPAIGLQLPEDTITCASELTLEALTAEPAQVLWLNMQGDTIEQGNQLLFEPQGQAMFLVQATDGNACTESDSLSITGNAAQVVPELLEAIACQNEALGIPFTNLNPADQLTLISDPPGLFVLNPQGDSLIVNTAEADDFDGVVTFVNQFGCEDTHEIELDIIGDNLNFSFAPVPECDGFTINFNNNSANTPFNYFSWDFGDPSNPNSVSDQFNPTYTYPDTGTYVVALTLSGGLECVDTLFQPLTIADEVLDARFEVIYEDCYTDSVAVVLQNMTMNTQTSFTQIQWVIDSMTVAATDKVQFTVVDSQSIQVTLIAETPFGCVDTVSELINVAPIEDVQLPSDLIGCNGEGVNLNPGGNPQLDYLWVPADGLDDPTAANPLAMPDSTTTYTAFIRNITSDTCELVRQITVTVPPPINLEGPQDSTTCESSLTLSANALPGVNWQWFDEDQIQVGSQSSITISPKGLKQYTVRATDAFGCFEQDTVEVGLFGLDISTVGDTFFCQQEDAFLAISNSDPDDQLSIIWEPAQYLEGDPTSDTVGVNTDLFLDTIFTLTVSNQYGCESKDTARVAVLDNTAPLDVLSFGQCDGLTVDFLMNTVNAGFYTWNFGDPANPGATAKGDYVSYTYPVAGTYTVTLVPDEAGIDCLPEVTFDVEVQAPPLFMLEASWAYEECGDSAIIAFTDESQHIQDDIVQWAWSFSNGDTDSTATPLVTINQDQTLDYQLIVTTTVGCVDTLDGSIEIDLIEVDLPDDLKICKGDSVALNPNTSNPDYTYLWVPSLGLDDPTSPNPVASPQMTTTYIAYISDSSSGDTCQIIRPVTVELFPELILDASDDVSLCEDVPVTLQASANLPSNLLWSDEPDFSNVLSTAQALTVMPGRPALFYVMATDANSCTTVDTIAVANYLPSVNLKNEYEICADEVVDLEVINNYPEDELTFDWFPEFYIISGAQSGSPTVQLDNSITFFVEITNQHGCVIIDSTYVDVIDLEDELTVFATPDTISFGESSQLFATYNLGYEYSWTPAETISDPFNNQPLASPTTSTVYNLKVTTPNGCVINRSVPVTIVERSCAEPYIFVPRAFTPNNDGENDIFYVRGNPIDEMELVIFNRWGEQVFRSTSKEFGWDGTFEGKELSPDVYGYYLEVTCFNGERYFHKGNVTLLR